MYVNLEHKNIETFAKQMTLLPTQNVVLDFNIKIFGTKMTDLSNIEGSWRSYLLISGDAQCFLLTVYVSTLYCFLTKRKSC